MKMAEGHISGAGNDASDTESMNTRNDNFLCGVVEGFYGRPWTTEQRKDLFQKMKKMGMNTYMYAPKDDLKHRAYWRELYTVEEADHLSSLIQAAKEQGVSFYYALSPGLDITYSNPKEVAALKRKLEQVSQFGCVAFALLFDDIEPEISETDKEVFQSFAHAQVSVTNEVYQHLGHQKFLFCPTEYCAVRAVPNVQNSDYLNTIGAKLHPGIDIMWTGAKVITRSITLQSIQELSEVLRRPPVIWDNLHANDYDQKRLFLGPYCGRSTELIPHLHGVLTNPNCEYETNFIPIHTLSQWSTCNADGKRDLSLNDGVSADIKLETESENGSIEDIPSYLGPNTYHPKKALRMAILDWLPEFNKHKGAYGRTIATAVPFTAAAAPIPICPPVVNTCMTVTLTTTTPAIPATSSSTVSAATHLPNYTPPEEPGFQPLTQVLVNSLVSSVDSKEEVPLEPMDCNSSPSASPKHPENNMEQGLSAVAASKAEKSSSKDATTFSEEMQTEPADDESNQISFDDVALLVDLFYLPFEHGTQGVQLLQEFQWLKTHCHLVMEHRRHKQQQQESFEVKEWYDRAAKYDQLTQATNRLLKRLTYCRNRALVYDVYPYLWDIKGVISLLNSYLKWLALGLAPSAANGYLSPPITWFSKGYKEAYMSGDQEPWLFRGGLTGELQHLLPLETVSDLFLYKPPETPTSKIYTIRPYQASDEESVYEICRKTCDDGLDGSEVFPDYPNLIGDKLVGGFLCLSPEYCFVVEDENGVCGYALVALDAQQFHKKLEIAWMPELCKKYPLAKRDPTDMLTPSEEIISSFHSFKMSIPELVYKHHPSVLRMSVLPSLVDLSVPKRLLACVIATLKSNGSHGVFCEVTVGDKNVLDFYSKLGFLEIALPGCTAEDMVFIGRSF